MAITVYSEDQILALALGYLQILYPGKATGPKSYLGDQARSLAQLVGAIEQAIQAADNDGVPAYDTASAVIKSRCSPRALDNWAVTFGLPSNLGPERYGRNGPQVATGGSGNVVGVPGVIVFAGELLVDLSGEVQVELVAGVTVPAGGYIPGNFQATSPGSAGNLPAGTRLQWQVPPPGIQPTVLLEAPLRGGYETESDLALLDRLINYLRDPPKGGTAKDYRVWAESAVSLTGASQGIVRAWVYPHRDGLGSEDIVISQGGSGQGRDPGPIKRNEVQAYIDRVRPVNDSPRVFRPLFNTLRGLRVVLQVQPSVLYPWDWIANSVSLAAGSTPSKLVIALGAMPSALLQVLSNGGKPRVQLVIEDDSPLPQVRTIVSYGIAGLNYELTLDENLSRAPAALVQIWPASGAVMPTAINVLAYIDSIGPSKQSGFHDDITDDWEAIVTVGKIAWAALSASDAIGQRVLVYSPSVGTGVGVRIQVGGAAPSAADVQLFDNLPNPGPPVNGPELPWAKSILVIPIQ